MSVLVDHCDSARVEVCLDSGQIGEQDHRLFVGSSSGAAAEQDDRGDGDVSGGEPSKGSRSGKAAATSSAVMPSATMSTTVATGIRKPRMQG